MLREERNIWRKDTPRRFDFVGLLLNLSLVELDDIISVLDRRGLCLHGRHAAGSEEAGTLLVQPPRYAVGGSSLTQSLHLFSNNPFGTRAPFGRSNLRCFVQPLQCLQSSKATSLVHPECDRQSMVIAPLYSSSTRWNLRPSWLTIRD